MQEAHDCVLDGRRKRKPFVYFKTLVRALSSFNALSPILSYQLNYFFFPFSVFSLLPSIFALYCSGFYFCSVPTNTR